jgi:protein-S-isoprenylcysteine O-methyltransferase Ste14
MNTEIKKRMKLGVILTVIGGILALGGPQVVALFGLARTVMVSHDRLSPHEQSIWELAMAFLVVLGLVTVTVGILIVVGCWIFHLVNRNKEAQQAAPR